MATGQHHPQFCAGWTGPSNPLRHHGGVTQASMYSPMSQTCALPYVPVAPQFSTSPTDPSFTSVSGGWTPQHDQRATRELDETKTPVCPFEQVWEKSFRLERDDPESPSSRDIHLVRVHRDPNVHVIPEFLTPAECDSLIEAADPYWERSLTSKGYASASQDQYVQGSTDTRTSYSARLPKGGSELIAAIEKRVAAITEVEWEYIEPLVVVRYKPQEYFKEHHDGFFRPSTVLIYLNDVPRGGETDFAYLGFKLVPQRGTAVVWRNVLEDGSPDFRLRHAGLPPLEGTKYVINCFINSKRQA